MVTHHDVAMEPVVVGDARITLVFSEPQFHGALPAEYLTVSVTGPDMSASRQVYAGWDGGFTALAAYFTSLAEDWRGWQGERVFESIEGDLRIYATHDGHVNLRVLLWESTVQHGWRMEVGVRLDAGEALSRAAMDVASLVRSREL